MPLQKCSKGGAPGWRWGASGACYPYEAGNAASEKAAKKRALHQGVAASFAQQRAGKTPDIPIGKE